MKMKKIIIFIFIIILMIMGYVFFIKLQLKWDDIWIEKTFAGKVEEYQPSLKEKNELNQLIWNLELDLYCETENEERIYGGESLAVIFEEGETIYVWAFTPDKVSCEKYYWEEGRKSRLWAESYYGNKDLYNEIKAYTEK